MRYQPAVFDRLADLATRRNKRVVALALALAVVAGALGVGVASRLSPYAADDPATDTYRASQAIQRATGVEARPRIVALVADQSRPKVERVAAILRADRAIGRVTTFYETGNRAMLSRDGHSTLVPAWIRRHADGQRAVDRLNARLREVPGVKLGGYIPTARATNKIVEQDLVRAELIAFPLLFLLSLWFFRGLVASALPPLLGGLAIVLALLGLRIATQWMNVSLVALNMIVGLGLGLAIDSSLFVLSRYREEIARRGPGAEALRATVGSAGRTVLFSSITVAAAMASLLVFPQKFLRSMGVGGVMVSVIAAGVALLVLPSVLALLGERVNAFSPAWLRRAAQGEARPLESGFWYRLSRFVMQRPGRVAVLSAGLLIALGLPFFGIRFTAIDSTVLSRSTAPRQVDLALRSSFPPNVTSPVSVAVHAPAGPRVTAFADHLRTLPGVRGVLPPRRLSAGLTQIDVITRGLALSDGSQRLVKEVRATGPPFRIGVTGETADLVDLKASLVRHLPVALGLVAATTAIVLFLMTGSLILPLKGLIMNLLSISAAFGLLVLIFKDGRLQGLLGYESQGALEATQPVLLFALAFGLSTDYGVFLLARIKEARDAGAADDEAIAAGLERTGRIVTAAALLFCVAVGAFATSRIVFIKELGVGTSLAVLIDATIVRALLVPALMELLGRWNWWAPPPLRRLHERIGLGEPVPV
ncbi:MAG: MMPL family transporter [Gaiellaceae bacterium]